MATEQITDKVQLGSTDLYVSPLGIGTWAWGDRFVWGYGGGTYSDSDLEAAFKATLDAGIDFFDTAELYGVPTHKSERLLGQFIKNMGNTSQHTIVATKFMPLPWRFAKSQLIGALRASLRALQMSKVDLYQIHWPSSHIDTWAEGLAEAVQLGLTKSVGVSNYSADQMRHTHELLAKHNLPLASNQVEYSLIERTPERNGVLAACQELGITLIAYSPLGMGLLSGKYTPANPPKGMRGRWYTPTYLTAVQPLIATMREIGAKHGDKTPAQVALNWTICKGTIPIPGAKNIKQALDNAGAIGWRLTADEVLALDSAADEVEKRNKA